MSRLLSHLPQLASLALAVLAAAVSHSVHVDRSASSRAGDSRQQAPRLPTGRVKAHHRSASTDRSASSHRSVSTGRKLQHRGHRASAMRAPQIRAPQERPAPSPVVTVSAPAPPAPRPRHVDRLRAEPGAEHGVDPAFGQPTLDPGQ
jgi:hypothetical protein